MRRPARRTRSKEETALDLARKITEVEAQIAPLQRQLGELRAQFSALLSNSGEVPETPEPLFTREPPAADGDGDAGLTIADKIETFMIRHAGNANADTIAAGVNMTDPKQLPTVRNTIIRMVRTGRLTYVARGIYGPPPRGGQ